MSPRPRHAASPFARNNNQQGFTLIELLVVIAIISILASILMPAFAQAREKARQTACLSNTKQLTTAFLMYTEDWDEAFPGASGNVDANYQVIPPCNTTRTGDWVLPQLIVDDNQYGHTANCGRAGQPVPNGALYSYVKNMRVYVCPSDAYGDQKTLSYAMNTNLSYSSLAALQEPTNTILLVDEGPTLDDGAFVVPDGTIPNPPVKNQIGIFVQERPSVVHNGGANFAYSDGHSKWHRPEQIKVSDFDPSYSQ